jgi:ubiquinone/menaquinone biosynthesis C-methylase UbiE
MQDLSYQEKQDSLKVRIRAHKEFANFDIADWMGSYLGRRPRTNIFDLGCGNGNHLGLYLEHVQPGGMVRGLDREKSLVEEARATYAAAKNLSVEVGSMDDPLPFPDGAFDICFSNFAIYNAKEPEKTLIELQRVLEPGGDLVLIGPTLNNAREIYEYNERLTGEAIDPITLIRTDRLRQEILPVAKRVFSNVSEEVINSYLTFPDREEFLLYYRATMLFEEGAAKKGYTHEQMKTACAREKDVVLSKEMLAVVAVKEA